MEKLFALISNRSLISGLKKVIFYKKCIALNILRSKIILFFFAYISIL